MKRLLYFLSLLGKSRTVPVKVKAQLKVLFMGNSYIFYNNLPQLVTYMADKTAIKLVTQKSTFGGASLSDHWDGRNGLKSKELIQNGKYDVVIIQENSMGGINSPDRFYKYTTLFADLIKSTGAKPYLMQPWARQQVPQYIDDLDKAHERAAGENNMTLLPVGRAWSMACTYRPTAPLFDADGSHPAALGTYLSAAVIVGSVCGDLPETIHHIPTIRDATGETLELMRLDSLDTTFVLKVAREALKMPYE